MSARAYKLRLTRVPPCCPHCVGAAAWGCLSFFFLQQTSPARTQHAKAGLHEPGKHTLTGRKCAGILWRNPRRPCQEGGGCAQHAPFASLPWQCAPQPQGSGAKALPPAHSLKRTSSLPQRPRPASPLRLQPAATKSRTELSSGSRMLVGPGGRHRYTHMNRDPAAARPCSKCRWASIREAWRQALPLDPNSSLTVSSWLDAKPHQHSRLCLGCGLQGLRMGF